MIRWAMPCRGARASCNCAAGDERDQLADLRVVDRVLDAIGLRSVGLADIDPDVKQQPLTDLALGGADSNVRERDSPRSRS